VSIPSHLVPESHLPYPRPPTQQKKKTKTDQTQRFHDHQIITSHKDSLGTELLSLPFRKDELEAILEDLMS